MSKILIIEPYRMLQHAFSAALFPEHEIELLESMPEPQALKDAEVLIVDAAALREHGSFDAGKLRAPQNWKIPTIWIDSLPAPEAPARDKLLSIKQVFTKEALQKALAECLGSSAGDKKTASPAATPGGDAVKSYDQSSAHSQADQKVIELVDVVEEGSVRGKSQGRAKK